MPRKKTTVTSNPEQAIVLSEHKEMTAAGQEVIVKDLDVPVLKQRYIDIKIQGDAPMILSAMTTEARYEILNSQTTKESSLKKTKKKEPINKFRRAIESVHLEHYMPGERSYLVDYEQNEDGIYAPVRQLTEDDWKAFAADIMFDGTNRVGYDASGIKKGLMEAVVRVLGESKSTIHNANIHVRPSFRNYVPIEIFGDIELDESIIPAYKGTFAVFRNVINNWMMTFTIGYNPDIVSDVEVMQIVQAMGFSGGLGAHRVGVKGGTNGSFKITGAADVTERELLYLAEKSARQKEMLKKIEEEKNLREKVA